LKPAPLQLDYVAAPRRQRGLGLLLLAASLMVSGYLGQRYNDARQTLLRLETEKGLVPVARRTAPLVPPERIEEQRRNVEAVVRKLSLPWGALISLLEQASTPDVALLMLEPDAEQRVLRVSGEARDRDAMFEYVRRLSAAGGLADVHLVSHQVQQDDPRHPVQFSVQGSLR
jgi:Tfp pilus assembly protein PilN